MRKKAKAKPRPKAKAANPSKFWLGLLLGGALAASAVHFGPTLLKNLEEDELVSKTKTAQEKTAPSQPKSIARPSAAGTGPHPAPAPIKPPSTAASPPKGTPQPPPAALPKPVPTGGFAIFRDPARAANLLTRLGMGESYPGSLLWKKSDALGWNAFGVAPTSRGVPVSTESPAANTVTCLLESTQGDHVQALRLIANVFGPRGDEATIAKFKSLTLAVLNETGCPATRQFLDAIDGTRGLQTESPGGRFTLSQTPLAPGTRWELVVQPR